MDQTGFQDEESDIHDAEVEGEDLPHLATRMGDLIERGKKDTSTVSEITITVYYTKQFRYIESLTKSLILQILYQYYTSLIQNISLL